MRNVFLICFPNSAYVDRIFKASWIVSMTTSFSSTGVSAGSRSSVVDRPMLECSRFNIIATLTGAWVATYLFGLRRDNAMGRRSVWFALSCPIRPLP